MTSDKAVRYVRRMTTTKLKLASREEAEKRDLDTFPAWGSLLSLAQFLERERRLRSHPWSLAAMKTWLLTNAEGSRVLSSCETFRMGPVHGIASVFTAEALRGKRYASTLIEKVMLELERQGPRNGGFLLYSEVGPAIYERLGFHLLESWQWSSAMPIHPDGPEPGILSEQAIRERLSADAASGKWEIAPSFDQLDWHWERERIYSEFLNLPRPRFHGLRGQNGGYSLWSAHFKAATFQALLFEPASEEDAISMLAGAARERETLGLARLSFWETPRALPGKLGARLLELGFRRERREDSLAMVRPLRKLTEIPRALWV